MKALLVGVLVASLASPAFSQPSDATWSDVPDRFQIDTGYFHISAETVLRFNGTVGRGDVDFETDLGVEPDVDTFWLDATWRLAWRHQLKLGYTRFNRERADHSLARDFEWGGETYNAGLSATASTGADILTGYYRVAVFRNGRFEVGPSVGFGYLWLRASIEATGRLTGPGGGEVSRRLDHGASTGTITGALGGYGSAWALRRLVFWGDFHYIKVSPGDTDASIIDGRVGADYYVLRQVGLGLQYKYNQYSYDRGIFVTTLGGDVTYEGIQVFLSARF